MKNYLATFVIIGLIALTGFWLSGSDNFKTEAQSSQAKVLRHVVFFDFNDQATDSVLKNLGNELTGLQKTVDSVRDIEWGANINNTKDTEYTHCLLVTFNSEEGLNKYSDHPDHLAIVEKHKKYLQKMAEIDYWHQ